MGSYANPLSVHRFNGLEELFCFFAFQQCFDVFWCEESVVVGFCVVPVSFSDGFCVPFDQCQKWYEQVAFCVDFIAFQVGHFVG